MYSVVQACVSGTVPGAVLVSMARQASGAMQSVVRSTDCTERSHSPHVCLPDVIQAHITGRNFTYNLESEPQRNLGDKDFSLPDQKMQGVPRSAGKVGHVSTGGIQGNHDEGWERRPPGCCGQ